MKVALYARVSTDDRDQNPETQLRHLRLICDANDYQIVEEFVDESSGRTIRGRPRYQAMMKGAAAHRFDSIMAYKLDRFHRNVMEQLLMSQQLQAYGVNLICTSEAIDTNTAMGRFFFVVMAALAECESSKTSERVKIGMERAAAEGKVCHRPAAKLSDYQLQKARDILAATPGISRSALAAQFDGIGRTTLIRLLKEAKILE